MRKPKSAQWPSHLPPLEQVALELHERSELLAALMIPTAKDDGPLSSRLGEVRVALPGEAWPESDGRPFVGLCQINVQESPFIPEQLQDLAFISIWMAAAEGHDPWFPGVFDESGHWDCDKVCIRVYRSLDGLVPIKSPLVANPFVPHGVRWELFDDPHPADSGALEWAEMKGLTREQASLILDELEKQQQERDCSERRSSSKLGGWPTPIQGPVVKPLALQLGYMPEVRMDWIDAGCFYIWRQETESPPWELDIQFY